MPVLCLRDAASTQWLRFAHPIDVIEVHALDEVQSALSAIEERVNTDGVFAAGFVSYDAAPAFDRALTVRSGGTTPLLWFGLFHDVEVIDAPVMAQRTASLSWTPSVSGTRYNDAIAAIKTHIADGDTYQVNYTFRLHADVSESPWDVFCALLHAQDAGYSAFIDTGSHAICSVSPELFFHLDGRMLTSRPMKGTAPRGRSSAEDMLRAEWLRHSEKNRAENVMIVDMLRNDIGRIADVGTVDTSSLFTVERYPTLWQMTSTVTGQTDAPVADIMRALFPCASITGAPKARTMEIIADLESTPRGLYTGAIGFIAPHRRAQFSVAIRTVVIDTARGVAEYGVGGGVTWESDASDEYAECLTKARVLTDRRPPFELLETIKWTKAEGFALIDRHLSRMRDSAAYFGIPFDDAAIRDLLTTTASTLHDITHIVRLLLDQTGVARCEASPLKAIAEPVRLVLAPTPVDSSDVFLFHKTTHRVVYEEARRARPDAGDVLLWNERGEVTESCIANLVVDLDGERVTPPVSCGLLTGTYRAMLLDDGAITERVIMLDDLKRCRSIWLVNSVRGEMVATF